MLIFFVMVFSAVFFSAVTPGWSQINCLAPSQFSIIVVVCQELTWVNWYIKMFSCGSFRGHELTLVTLSVQSVSAVSVLHVWLLEWSNFTGPCKYCGRLLWWGFDAHLSMMCRGASQLCIVMVCERDAFYHAKITARRMYLLERVHFYGATLQITHESK